MNERRGNVGGNYQAVTGESGIDGIMTIPAKSSRENLATKRPANDSMQPANILDLVA